MGLSVWHCILKYLRSVRSINLESAPLLKRDGKLTSRTQVNCYGRGMIMSLKKLFFSIFIVFSLLFVCQGALVMLLLENQDRLQDQENTRYQSYLVADEFRKSSQDLTRLARTYVATESSKYETMYNDVIAVRDGNKPRPDGRTISLKQIMKDLGFAAEEFSLLDEAANKSNELVATEVKAMNAVKGLFGSTSNTTIISKK